MRTTSLGFGMGGLAALVVVAMLPATQGVRQARASGMSATGGKANLCQAGERVGAPPLNGEGPCSSCQPPAVTPTSRPPTTTPPVTNAVSNTSRPDRVVTMTPSVNTTTTFGSGTLQSSAATFGGVAGSGGTLDPDRGAICLSVALVANGSRTRERGPDCVLYPPPETPGGGLPESEEFGFPQRLTYDSQINLNRMTGNWWFPFDVYVVQQANGDLHLYSPDVVALPYVWNAGSGLFTSPPGAFDVMAVDILGGWARRTRDGTVWHFNVAGHLDYIRDRYGLQTTFTRTPGNQLTSWTDFAGRTTNVTYNVNGYASAITDWGGRSITFAYTAQGYLASITFPATTYYDTVLAQSVTGNRSLTFSYVAGTGTPLDGNLVNIFDASGSVAMSNTYDGFDRATQSQNRSRAWTYSYLMNGDTRVVDPDGVTTDYTLTNVGAIWKKRVYTRTGLGQSALRSGEPTSYLWQYDRGTGCGCDLISKITYPDGCSSSFTYDGWGNVLSATRANAGSTTTLTDSWTYSSFAQFCRTLTHVSPGGNAAGATTADFRTTFSYDTSGSCTQIQYPKALVQGTATSPTITMARGTAGTMTQYTDPSGMITQYSYSTNGTLLVTSVVEDLGGIARTTGFGYDGYDRLTSMTLPGSVTWTYGWNALDQLISEQGPASLAPQKTWLYDQNNNVYRIEVENKDAAGNLVSGNPVWSTYLFHNASNQLSSLQEELSASTTATTQLTYTPGGRLMTVTDPNGSVRAVAYDERGLKFTTTEGTGAIAGTTTYSYDLNGRLSQVNNPRGYNATWSYDFADRPTQITYPNGTYATAAWNPDSLQTQFVSYTSSGVAVERTNFTYDPMGNLGATTRHLLNVGGSSIGTLTTTVLFDECQRPTSRTTPGNATTTLSYDALGRCTDVMDPAGNVVQFTRNLHDDATAVTRKDLRTGTSTYDIRVEEFTYDALLRVSSALRRDNGSTTSQSVSVTRDGLGRILLFTDYLGNTQHYTWDGRGQLLTTVHDVRSGGTGSGSVVGTVTTTRVLDAGGRLITLQDPKGQTTQISYDARNRVAQSVDAGGTTALAYDLNSNLTQRTDRLGTVVTNSFDSMDRLTARSIQPATGVLGTTSESYGYDALGRATSAVDNDSSCAWTYDSQGRTLSETQGSRLFGYAYNADDFLTAVTYPDTTQATVTIDAVGRMTTQSVGSTTLVTNTHSGRRRLTSVRPQSLTCNFGFDSLFHNDSVDQLQNGNSIAKFTYVFNAGSLRAFEKRHHAGGAGDNYAFDSLYQVTQVKVGVADPAAEHTTPGSQSTTSVNTVTYDAAGSRSQLVITGAGAGTTNYSADSLNAYTSVGGVTHVRNAEGQLTDDGTFLYAYDYRGQLVEVTNKATSALVAEYEYDARGRRTNKTVGGAVTEFAWTHKLLAEEYDSAGLASRRHYDLLSGEVAAAWQRDRADLDGDSLTSDMVWVYPLYDGASDCVGLAGPAGQVVERYVHSFDGVVAITNGAGTPLNASSMGWQQGYGHLYRDDETGLCYALHRYYNPDLARFNTEDPIGRWYDPLNVGNGYSYVGNNFRNDWDPSGLKAGDTDCCGKFAVVINNNPSKFSSVKPVEGAANHFSQAALDKVKKALGENGFQDTTAEFTWNDTTNNSDVKNKYLDWLKIHAKCLEVFVIWGHGSNGTVEAFDEALTASQLLPGVDPKQLDVAVLGACDSLQGGFQGFAETTIGYWGGSVDVGANAAGFSSRASNAIGGGTTSESTRADSAGTRPGTPGAPSYRNPHR